MLLQMSFEEHDVYDTESKSSKKVWEPNSQFPNWRAVGQRRPTEDAPPGLGQQWLPPPCAMGRVWRTSSAGSLARPPHALPCSLLPRARARTPSHLSVGSSRALPCSALLGQLKRSGFLAAVYHSPEHAVAHRRQSLAEAKKEGKQKDSASLEGFYCYQ